LIALINDILEYIPETYTVLGDKQCCSISQKKDLQHLELVGVTKLNLGFLMLLAISSFINRYIKLEKR